MLSALSGVMRAALVFAAPSPFIAGAEWGAAILVPLMIIAIGLANTAGLVTRRRANPNPYQSSTVTDFENVSCRTRAVGCLVSLAGLALLAGGIAFLISHG